MEHVAYVDAVSHIMEAMVGAGEITQILINSPSDFGLAVTSPITQFIYITVRPLHDRRYELVPLLGRLKEQLKMVPGCVASCWGPCIEQDTVQVGLVGWNSLHVSRFQLCIVGVKRNVWYIFYTGTRHSRSRSTFPHHPSHSRS